MAKVPRVVIAVMGTGILVIGLDAVIRGANAIPGTMSASARIDSEVRFFAAWYAVAGAFLLVAAWRTELMRVVALAVGAGFGLAACGRALSWATVGRPETLQIALMYVEFGIALILILWQLVATREGRPRRRR